MSQPLVLNNASLASLPDHIIVPAYPRNELKTGIVHVGVGGFHRSHEAWYTDTYMGQSQDTNWGICGVGLREEDRKMQALLAQQDFLYSLLVKQPDGRFSVQVIGCLTDFLLAVDDPVAVIEKMAAPDTRIISLTITEGGYNFNPATMEFDFANPDVQHDLATPDAPRLIFGYLAAALKRRQQRGLTTLTIQSCDNIQHNGEITRKMLLAYLNASDPALAEWVAEHVSFPNAMVDRITPATTPADIQQVRDAGVIDAWPVTCEPFHQWVIEDNFAAGRPLWERCGAQFVSDVTPYETMKIRLLNASHTVLGLLGSLHGYQTIDEAIQDELFARFVRQFMDNEATPTLAPVPGVNLDTYKSTLLERFANPNIKDSLTRICSESSSKVATFLVPTVNHNLQSGGYIDCAALVVAAWCFYSDKHCSQTGMPLDVIDIQAELLQNTARQSACDPLAFLHLRDIFGALTEYPVFTCQYQSFLRQLYCGVPVKTLMFNVVALASAAPHSTAEAAAV